ncbi:uncharacterized protein LOC133172221 [Saccostrea echinata]|uniref:uncharacterized protein LOC133172221 n=1 Tax=Saccostrea echinata TaxID=191078 RepID=UPI002A831BFC|nr:uncharacterized protein LOC133172221 [Saccostrea echinata]
MKLVFWITFFFLQVASCGNVQMLVTRHPMTWRIADTICTKEFMGTGYRHLAGDIPDTVVHYNLLSVKDHESLWLDGLIYDLGCRGDICPLVIERHREYNSHRHLLSLCQEANGVTVKPRHFCNSISNITSTYMISKLRREFQEFAKGREFIISKIALEGSTETKCQMVRKAGNRFQKMQTRCNEFHKALCEHNTDDSDMVTTIQYGEEKKASRTIFIPHPIDSESEPMKDEKEDSGGSQEIVWTIVSVTVALLSLSLCIGGLIYCRRNKIKMSSVYDTVFRRPRGGNNYTLRVPNDPTSPISEPTNHPLPPAAPPMRNPTAAAPIIRNPTAPPRVDSVQTLVSSTASSADTTSYVDDVRYYRNFSYETQPSVAPSQAPRIEIQPSTPTASTSGSTPGRLYCSSCRRHKRRRDFLRTSSNCTSCSSMHSAYTQPSRLAERNISLDTNDTASVRSQRSSRDTNDTNSMRSNRSHRFRKISHRGVSKKSSNKSGEADLHVGPTESPDISTQCQMEIRGSNPVLRKHKLVDRIQSSSGFQMVKRMFSIDLK